MHRFVRVILGDGLAKNVPESHAEAFHQRFERLSHFTKYGWHKLKSNKRPLPQQTAGSILLANVPSLLQRFDDLLAVKPPVFDEDFSSMSSADYNSGQRNSRHVAFVSLRVERWPLGLRIELYPHALHKGEIRMI